jgi:hypothetical protein
MAPEEIVIESVKALGIIGGAVVILLRMGRMAGQFEMIGKQQAQEITEIKREMKVMSDTVTTVAVQKNEIANIHEDITRLYRWYDELRHGRGYVEKGPE